MDNYDLHPLKNTSSDNLPFSVKTLPIPLRPRTVLAGSRGCTFEVSYRDRNTYGSSRRDRIQYLKSPYW